MKNNLQKYALITGGSRGIGKAIAKQLASDLEYSIILTYRSNEAAAQKTRQEIETLGVSCSILQFDVADKKETERALAEWRKNFPEATIEILINNAGITNDGLFIWMKEEAWDNVIQTSVKGFYNLTQEVLKPMLQQRYGRIINIVSYAGVHGNAGQTNYSAAKSAVIGATQALAKEIAGRKVTVNAVAPGFIESDMTQELDEKKLTQFIPAKRFGKPEEVAQLVSFLASEKSGYITGETININGGMQ